MKKKNVIIYSQTLIGSISEWLYIWIRNQIFFVIISSVYFSVFEKCKIIIHKFWKNVLVEKTQPKKKWRRFSDKDKFDIVNWWNSKNKVLENLSQWFFELWGLYLFQMSIDEFNLSEQIGSISEWLYIWVQN